MLDRSSLRSSSTGRAFGPEGERERPDDASRVISWLRRSPPVELRAERESGPAQVPHAGDNNTRAACEASDARRVIIMTHVVMISSRERC